MKFGSSRDDIDVKV